MPFTPGKPSDTASWTSSQSTTNNSWVTQVPLEVYDRLIDSNGNYIVDIQGNYISLGGGVTAGDADADGSWSNPAGISTIWTVVG